MSNPNPQINLSLFQNGTNSWNNSGTILLVSGGVILLAVIIVFIVILIRRSSKQGSLLLSTPYRLDKRAAKTVSSGKIVATANGQEFTYAFWLFLGDKYETTAHPKVLLHRGSETLTVDSSNPVIYLDGQSNKLTVALATTASTNPSSLPIDAIKNSTAYEKLDINYTPLQRWVHVAVSVQDNVSVLYLDGQLHVVKTLTNTDSSSSTNRMLKGTVGDVHIGDGAYGTYGYITKLEFFNYFMTQTEAQALYEQGPNTGNAFTRMLGLSAYGMRTPIYRKDGEVCNA